MISALESDTTDENLQKDNTQFQFDTVIVFGEGPVKPILLENELTPEQRQEWENFKQDQWKNPEPNFWLMQQPRYLSRLEKIAIRDDISEEEKKTLKLQEIKKWQHMGWFSLKRMGRQNALAAGYALYKGLTKEVIVSGGRTISKWAKDNLSKEQLENWPSEAELMADIIKTHYGELYEKKFGKKIDEVIKIEDASTNTLENFVYTVNSYPQLLADTVKIGFLSAGHHMKRLRLLAQIFGLHPAENCDLSAQELLKQANGFPEQEDEIEVNSCIVDETNCADTKEQYSREERWIRGLKEPQYVTYWLGYVAEVKHQCVLQKAIDRLTDEAWKRGAEKALQKLGINIDEIAGQDLTCLAKNNPEKYTMVIGALQQLKKPEYRVLPSQDMI